MSTCFVLHLVLLNKQPNKHILVILCVFLRFCSPFLSLFGRPLKSRSRSITSDYSKMLSQPIYQLTNQIKGPCWPQQDTLCNLLLQDEFSKYAPSMLLFLFLLHVIITIILFVILSKKTSSSSTVIINYCFILSHLYYTLILSLYYSDVIMII